MSKGRSSLKLQEKVGVFNHLASFGAQLGSSVQTYPDIPLLQLQLQLYQPIRGTTWEELWKTISLIPFCNCHRLCLCLCRCSTWSSCAKYPSDRPLSQLDFFLEASVCYVRLLTFKDACRLSFEVNVAYVLWLISNFEVSSDVTSTAAHSFNDLTKRMEHKHIWAEIYHQRSFWIESWTTSV